MQFIPLSTTGACVGQQRLRRDDGERRVLRRGPPCSSARRSSEWVALRRPRLAASPRARARPWSRRLGAGCHSTAMERPPSPRSAKSQLVRRCSHPPPTHPRPTPPEQVLAESGMVLHPRPQLRRVPLPPRPERAPGEGPTVLPSHGKPPPPQTPRSFAPLPPPTPAPLPTPGPRELTTVPTAATIAWLPPRRRLERRSSCCGISPSTATRPTRMTSGPTCAMWRCRAQWSRSASFATSRYRPWPPLPTTPPLTTPPLPLPLHTAHRCHYFHGCYRFPPTAHHPPPTTHHPSSLR